MEVSKVGTGEKQAGGGLTIVGALEETGPSGCRCKLLVRGPGEGF